MGALLLALAKSIYYQIDKMKQFFGHMPQRFCTSLQPELLP